MINKRPSQWRVLNRVLIFWSGHQKGRENRRFWSFIGKGFYEESLTPSPRFSWNTAPPPPDLSTRDLWSSRFYFPLRVLQAVTLLLGRYTKAVF